MTRPRADMFFSADIEADGPVPGPYSMLSMGLCVVGRHEPGGSFDRHDPRAATFYRELCPISDTYDPAALAVSGLDRAALVAGGTDPTAAMADAAAWVREHAGGDRAVLVGWPLVFDWMFLHWYFVRFCPDGDPFGHSSALDIKTFAWARTGRVVDLLTPASLPEQVQSSSPHTHNALDDAVEQGEVFANLLEWVD